MILTCPECKSRYVVNPTALMPSGRTVRCAKCSHNWFEERPEEDVEVVPPVEDETGEKPEAEEAKEAPGEKAPAKEAAAEEKETAKSEENDDNFDFPINNPKKRRRPIPKGSNLPALQNQKYGSNKLGWVFLLVFITAVVSLFLIMQEKITDNWPASKKLYYAIGLDGSEVVEPDEGPELKPISERLKIGGLAPRRETINNISNLVIAGVIENISDEIQTIPELRVRLIDENRNVVREWSFSTEPSSLNPGETVNFQSSLPSPPPEARDISVIFTTNN